jgi:hypothetical protein
MDVQSALAPSTNAHIRLDRQDTSPVTTLPFGSSLVALHAAVPPVVLALVSAQPAYPWRRRLRLGS